MTTLTNDVVYDRGKAVAVPGVQIEDKRLVVEGRFLTVARLRDEWYDELGDPEVMLRHAKEGEAT